MKDAQDSVFKSIEGVLIFNTHPKKKGTKKKKKTLSFSHLKSLAN